MRSYLTIVSPAHAQGMGILRLERLTGHRLRTARASRGANARTAAKARKNNRLIAT